MERSITAHDLLPSSSCQSIPFNYSVQLKLITFHHLHHWMLCPSEPRKIFTLKFYWIRANPPFRSLIPSENSVTLWHFGRELSLSQFTGYLKNLNRDCDGLHVKFARILWIVSWGNLCNLLRGYLLTAKN